MVCRINDFKYKDVVDAADGCRLGYVGDVELDTTNDLVIPWEDIQVIGQDTILVRTRPAALSGRRRHKP